MEELKSTIELLKIRINQLESYGGDNSILAQYKRDLADIEPIYAELNDIIAKP